MTEFFLDAFCLIFWFCPLGVFLGLIFNLEIAIKCSLFWFIMIWMLPVVDALMKVQGS